MRSKCNLPNLMLEMIGCEAGKNICDKWRYLDCADVEKIPTFTAHHTDRPNECHI